MKVVTLEDFRHPELIAYDPPEGYDLHQVLQLDVPWDSTVIYLGFVLRLEGVSLDVNERVGW